MKQVIFLMIFGLLFLSSINAIAKSCLISKSLNSFSCAKEIKPSVVSVEPTLIAYRFAVQGSTERKCRFEPTCSKFFVESMKKHGVTKGILYGFSRAQLRHDDDFGRLKSIYARDGFVVFLDPVENWK
jgi:hypothetical protein